MLTAVGRIFVCICQCSFDWYFDSLLAFLIAVWIVVLVGSVVCWERAKGIEERLPNVFLRLMSSQAGPTGPVDVGA